MENKLYLVPTPIGNLKDITLRALEVLKGVDIIAAEDTRQTLKLLNHYEIKKTLISYHKHNEQSKGEEIIDLLKQGKSVAIVTDAGTPGISDPGAVVVRKCIDENIPFEVLTGATAITTALVYSGIDTSSFVFKGFIPRETKQRKVFLEEIKSYTDTIIIYESPYRVKNTLITLKECLGNRQVALCRELTKLYEEIKRGTIDELLEDIQDKIIKGEFVIVIEGKTYEEIAEENKEKWDNMTISEHIIKYMTQGMSKKEAMKLVSKDRGMPKSEVYKYSLEIKSDDF